MPTARGEPKKSIPELERHCAAAMGNNEFQGRKILEQIAQDELHEDGGIAGDVMRTGVVEVGIARATDMQHRRYVELHQLFP